MDQRLKDILERAEAWPEEARDELVKAAKTIDARVTKVRKPREKVIDRHDVGEGSPTGNPVYDALIRAPKVGLMPPQRGVRVRVRPLPKF